MEQRIYDHQIGLEKAYDRLSWDFIQETLTEAGLRQDWTRNIMCCIESPRLSIFGMGKIRNGSNREEK